VQEERNAAVEIEGSAGQRSRIGHFAEHIARFGGSAKRAGVLGAAMIGVRGARGASYA
jgi:hypothetical protein